MILALILFWSSLDIGCFFSGLMEDSILASEGESFLDSSGCLKELSVRDGCISTLFSDKFIACEFVPLEMGGSGTTFLLLILSSTSWTLLSFSFFFSSSASCFNLSFSSLYLSNSSSLNILCFSAISFLSSIYFILSSFFFCLSYNSIFLFSIIGLYALKLIY